MPEVEDHFPTVLAGDLQELCLGEKLGFGCSREVYVWLPEPTLVIKLESKKHSWANIEEWNTWQAVQHTKAAKWFAPVVQIAGNGSILLQKRTTPLRREELPTKLPAFLTDTKATNFGMLDGRVVCHDYGIHLLRVRGMSQRLVKASWWDLE